MQLYSWCQRFFLHGFPFRSYLYCDPREKTFFSWLRSSCRRPLERRVVFRYFRPPSARKSLWYPHPGTHVAIINNFHCNVIQLFPFVHSVFEGNIKPFLRVPIKLQRSCGNSCPPAACVPHRAFLVLPTFCLDD